MEHNCCSNKKHAVGAVVGTGCNGLGTGADAAERRRLHPTKKNIRHADIHWQDYQHSLPYCCDDSCREVLQTRGMKGMHEGQNSKRHGGEEHDNYMPIRLLLLLLLVVMGAVILFYGATIIGHSTRLFRSIVASWPCDARASSTSSSRITIIPMNGMMFVVIIEW